MDGDISSVSFRYVGDDESLNQYSELKPTEEAIENFDAYTGGGGGSNGKKK